jgi:hypothetical protein
MQTKIGATLVNALCIAVFAHAAGSPDSIRASIDSSVDDWRFALGDYLGVEAPQFDDSSWQVVQFGHEWRPHDSRCWFRRKIVVPERVSGVPVNGNALRLRLFVDNGAKVYVNGSYVSEFEWDEGNVILTDHAVPGQAIYVAIQGINGPGQGKFYEAWLTMDAGEPMLAPLRDLLTEFDVALSDADYRTSEFDEHWGNLIKSACAAIDMEALRVPDSPAFLSSLENARAIMLSDRSDFESTLQTAARTLAELKEKLAIGKLQGLQLAYPTVRIRVLESFIQYARDDMQDKAPGRQLRALKIAWFIGQLADQALGEMNAALADARNDLKVPVCHTGPYEIRNGAFYQDGTPIFFTGVGHFGQVRQDTPILNEYGLNAIQIEIGPNSVVTGPSEINTEPIRANILSALDNAATHNVAVNLLVSPHYFPAWANELNPEKGKCGLKFLKNCIDSPLARDVYERYMRALMPLIANHPALHSICLSNEPEYVGRCQYSRKEFRAWLEVRHGTLEALNRAHSAAFKSFDDVPIPEDESNFPLYTDFCRYNQDRFLAFHKFLAGLVHEFDPDLPVHAKPMAHAFEDPGRFSHGVNFEDFNNLGTITGNDCYQNFIARDRGEYAQNWKVMAMNYTHQRSTHPGAPIFNSEAHVIPDGYKYFVPPTHIRTAYYTMALHGQGAATTWIWERGQSGDHEQNILTRPECVLALGTIGLDLNRLGPEIVALQNARQEVALFYSYSSLPASLAHVTEVSAAFEGLYFCDMTAAFITERQTLAGMLSNYRVVVVPAASHVPDSVFAAFQRYIDAGGSVVAIGPSFMHNEYGQSRSTPLSAGKSGKLISYPGSLPAKAYREILDRALDDAGVKRPIRLEGEHGESVWGVNQRESEYQGTTLLSLVNFMRDAKKVQLKARKPIQSAMNLLTGASVTFPLHLDSLEPVLLKLVWNE